MRLAHLLWVLRCWLCKSWPENLRDWNPDEIELLRSCHFGNHVPVPGRPMPRSRTLPNNEYQRLTIRDMCPSHVFRALRTGSRIGSFPDKFQKTAVSPRGSLSGPALHIHLAAPSHGMLWYMKIAGLEFFKSRLLFFR